MQADYPAHFSRDQGCTEAEWLRWLPGAVRDQALQRPAPGLARIALASGMLTVRWHALPPRRIALVSLPRLQIDYAFDAGIGAAERSAFMRYFDLYMQRGGG